MTAPYEGTALLRPPPGESVPPEQPPATHRRQRRRGRIAAVAVLAVVAGAGGGLAASSLRGAPATVASSPTVTTRATGASTTAEVVKAVSPSVVMIVVTAGGSTEEGSGIVVRSDGLVLTNAHVVASAELGADLSVTLADGRSLSASVVGSNTDEDVAVVKVEGASGLTPATLGTSAALQAGDSVMAVGSPLGLEGTVTSGIVSALHRSVEIGGDSQPFAEGPSTTLRDAIQTDAAVNPGNSGGPLVDAAGHVVGMTTAMATVNDQSGGVGIGFAIPIDRAWTVARQIIAAG
jgi:putative serine protease PepD